MAKIFYTEVDDFDRKEIRLKFLEKQGHIYNIDWKEIIPDKNNNWLNEGMQDDFSSFISIASKEAKAGKENNVIFKIFSLGVSTNRDAWVYNSDKNELEKNIKNTIEVYNENVFKYSRQNPKPIVDDFVEDDDNKISWSRDLKLKLKRGNFTDYSDEKKRLSLYRPFFKNHLYFDRTFVDILAQFHKIFPTSESEKENLVICSPSKGGRLPFWCISTNVIPNLALTSLDANQCYPFYTYNEDGTGRKENITDWALQEYQNHYKDNKITKWVIFYYIYAVLHKPEYRTKYAANLRRELPRIPFYDDFWKFSESGKKLSELHVNYESQPEYPLTKIEAPGKQLDYKVEKIKLSKDKQTLIYNEFLSLTGIPYDCFDYKLGNRSALEWLIDQYQIKTDKRSGIVNDPNRPDEPDYILKLIAKIITVSIETMKIIDDMKENNKIDKGV